MAALDDLRSEVAESRTVAASAVTLLDGLSRRIGDILAGNNVEGDLRALQQELDTSNADLAAAVARNTAAAGEPTGPGTGGDTGGDTGGGTDTPPTDPAEEAMRRNAPRR